jgi:hypothetical protein
MIGDNCKHLPHPQVGRCLPPGVSISIEAAGDEVLKQRTRSKRLCKPSRQHFDVCKIRFFAIQPTMEGTRRAMNFDYAQQRRLRGLR